MGANAEDAVGQATDNAEMKEVSKADVEKEKGRRRTYNAEYDFPSNSDDVTLSRFQDHLAALAAGHLTPFDEQWENVIKKHDTHTEVFPAHWETASPVSDLMNVLKQISNLMTSSPGEELFPLLMLIGKHKPHLPRGSAKSSTLRRPNESIIGRFITDSKNEAASSAPKPEIMKDHSVGHIVIFGTQSYRVIMIVKQCGEKLHVCPTPREGDVCKLWLRKYIAVQPNVNESRLGKLHCVFADVMDAPVLADPSDVLPLFTKDDAPSGFIIRETSLSVPTLLYPPDSHRRNLNVWALHALHKYDKQALTKDLKPPFQKMLRAFLHNIKTLPKAILRGPNGSMLDFVQRVLDLFTKHQVPEIADAAKAILM